MDVTILRIDLGDAEFNAPFVGGEDAAENDDEESEATGTSDGGTDPKPIAALAVLVGLAVLWWYLRSGDDDVAAEADELEIEEP